MNTAINIDLSKRFRRAGKPRRESMSFTVEGKRNSGKSRYCFTMPKPLAIINIDNSLEGVEQKHPADGVMIAEYSSLVPPTLDRDSNSAMRDHFKRIWGDMLEDIYAAADSGIKSLAIDGGTDMWEICRYVHFGRLEKIPSHLYVEPNADFEAVINYIKDKCNLVITHRVRDVWEERSYTTSSGEMKVTRAPKLGVDGEVVTERAGYSHIGFKVDASIGLRFVEPTHDITKPDRPMTGEGRFYADILSCKDTPELVGTSLDSAALEGGISFPEIATLIYPDYAEVWGG